MKLGEPNEFLHLMHAKLELAATRKKQRAAQVLLKVCQAKACKWAVEHEYQEACVPKLVQKPQRPGVMSMPLKILGYVCDTETSYFWQAQSPWFSCRVVCSSGVPQLTSLPTLNWHKTWHEKMSWPHTKHLKSLLAKHSSSFEQWTLESPKWKVF